MPLFSPRPIIALLLLVAATLTSAPAPGQSVALAPFRFDPPPGFARVGGEGGAAVMRDGAGNEVSAESYPGPHPLAGLAPDELAASLGDTLRRSLAPAGFGWIDPPRAERRADGVTVFRALAARAEARGVAFQFVLYAIAPAASLYVAYAGIGEQAAARAAADALARSVRVAPP